MRILLLLFFIGAFQFFLDKTSLMKKEESKVSGRSIGINPILLYSMRGLLLMTNL
jgi:hypothetical protein